MRFNGLYPRRRCSWHSRTQTDLQGETNVCCERPASKEMDRKWNGRKRERDVKCRIGYNVCIFLCVSLYVCFGLINYNNIWIGLNPFKKRTCLSNAPLLLLLFFYLTFFIWPLFNHVGKLRRSSHLQLRPGQEQSNVTQTTTQSYTWDKQTYSQYHNRKVYIQCVQM